MLAEASTSAQSPACVGDVVVRRTWSISKVCLKK
jgi:hypothetical protein